jgi:hypothetical protein
MSLFWSISHHIYQHLTNIIFILGYFFSISIFIYSVICYFLVCSHCRSWHQLFYGCYDFFTICGSLLIDAQNLFALLKGSLILNLTSRLFSSSCYLIDLIFDSSNIRSLIIIDLSRNFVLRTFWEYYLLILRYLV